MLGLQIRDVSKKEYIFNDKTFLIEDNIQKSLDFYSLMKKRIRGEFGLTIAILVDKFESILFSLRCLVEELIKNYSISKRISYYVDKRNKNQ